MIFRSALLHMTYLPTTPLRNHGATNGERLVGYNAQLRCLTPELTRLKTLLARQQMPLLKTKMSRTTNYHLQRMAQRHKLGTRKPQQRGHPGNNLQAMHLNYHLHLL